MQLRRIAPVAGAAVMVVVSSIAVATAGAVGTQAKVRSAAGPLALHLARRKHQFRQGVAPADDGAQVVQYGALF